jgi:hypothetical protein
MRLFKGYTADDADHELVLARTPFEAAEVARTVWAEAGTPRHHAEVVEPCLPEGDIGLIYGTNMMPVAYPKSSRRKA